MTNSSSIRDVNDNDYEFIYFEKITEYIHIIHKKQFRQGDPGVSKRTDRTGPLTFEWQSPLKASPGYNFQFER